MAHERIDPFSKEDRFCVDHILRYHFAKSFVQEKRVLDIACGTGFGTVLLAHANAKHVLGVDRCEETIAECRCLWKIENGAFAAGNIESIKSLNIEPLDVAVCFETLEHIADPVHALSDLKSVIAPDGLLIGSVPTEADAEEDNEFHLHQFTADKIETHLSGLFRHYSVLKQEFSISSTIAPYDKEAIRPISEEKVDNLFIDLGRARPLGDTYIFIASDQELPKVQPTRSASSRQAWCFQHEESKQCFQSLDRSHDEIKRIYSHYRRTFSELGDLKRRFTNVLGWGKFHYEQLHGKQPEAHYLEKIEKAQSGREIELRDSLEKSMSEASSLKNEIDSLRATLDATQEELTAFKMRAKQRYLYPHKNTSPSAGTGDPPPNT